MRARIGVAARAALDSYFFLPGLMSLLAMVLSVVLTEVDDAVGIDGTGDGFWHGLVFSGGPDAAQDVLSAIAGSSITVAGVVFSITMVALTLASQQFGARLLSSFMADRGNQVTLGTFISSYLYSLLVLRSVRLDSGPAGVPHLAVTAALVFAVAGVVVLIYFIHHVATTIQVSNLIATVGGEFRRTMERAFPEDGPATLPPDVPVEDGVEILSSERGYIELIDLDALYARAVHHDVEVRVDRRAGQFVVPGEPWATVWPADAVDAELASVLSGCVVTGTRRTAFQDVEFPAWQLAEIAVRALSPGINDPHTAISCIDQLSGVLAEVVTRPLTVPHRADDDGRVRVRVGDAVTFDRMVGAAYDEIRQCAGSQVAVHLSLLEALTRVARLATDPERVAVLVGRGELVMAAAEHGVELAADLAVVRERCERLRARMRAQTTP